MMNTIYLSDFCKECPFNIPISNINNNNICKNNICILNYENLTNEYPYEYFCNYNPINYFDEGNNTFRKRINDSYIIESDYEIKCEKYEFNN